MCDDVRRSERPAAREREGSGTLARLAEALGASWSRRSGSHQVRSVVEALGLHLGALILLAYGIGQAWRGSTLGACLSLGIATSASALAIRALKREG